MNGTRGPAPAPETPNLVASDGFMQGFPPPIEKRIRFGDGSFMGWPQTRWSYNHPASVSTSVAVVSVVAWLVSPSAAVSSDDDPGEIFLNAPDPVVVIPW